MCIESCVESMTLIYLLAIKPLTAIKHSLLNSGSAGNAGQSRSRQYLALRDRKNDFGLQPFGDVDFDDDSVAAVRKLTGKRPNETSSASERPNGRSLTCYSHAPGIVVGAAILGTHSTGREAHMLPAFFAIVTERLNLPRPEERYPSESIHYGD